MKPSDVIRGAMDLIPDEDHWWRGNSTYDPKAVEGHCVVTALGDIGGENLPALGVAESLVAEESPVLTFLEIPDWNDDPHTTFLDVQLVLKRALARAEEDES